MRPSHDPEADPETQRHFKLHFRSLMTRPRESWLGDALGGDGRGPGRRASDRVESLFPKYGRRSRLFGIIHVASRHLSGGPVEHRRASADTNSSADLLAFNGWRRAMTFLYSRVRSNHAMERTPDRCALHFDMTSTPPLRAARALVRRRSSCSR